MKTVESDECRVQRASSNVLLCSESKLTLFHTLRAANQD